MIHDLINSLKKFLKAYVFYSYIHFLYLYPSKLHLISLHFMIYL